MKGIIFSVKRYAIHDGPGIRVVFFMKGCPLSCWWCHNPEGIKPEPEEIVQINKVGEREFRHRTMVGKEYSVGDILAILERERVFIQSSGGGVTFSGGEPVVQNEFLSEALKACRESGFPTAVDTAGYYRQDLLVPVMKHTDLFLYDLKHPDPASHLNYTGGTNEPVIENLKFLVASGKEVIIRIPVVPGINDGPEALKGFLNIINECGGGRINRISLLPFHRIGAAKYHKFGRHYRMDGYEQPDDGRMNEIAGYFSASGLNVKIGG
ncbi:MAG TPA: glycyl-radical enzyme activating protein [Bacteroidales bacterium]|nr:glycyl-radical enzyme activating protein [Bacteroidales bacterium]